MGLLSISIEKLPAWAHVILMIITFLAFIWGVVHFGWTFILKVIFSPDL